MSEKPEAAVIENFSKFSDKGQTKLLSTMQFARDPSHIFIVVRARRERKWAPCIENSFSRKRQHIVVVAAAPSSVVF